VPRRPKTVPTTRINLEVIEPVRQRLERLQKRSEADSMVEVIRRALAVYEVLWEAKDEGASVIVRSSEGEEREVILTP
jgi:hypothetical protein